MSDLQQQEFERADRFLNFVVAPVTAVQAFGSIFLSVFFGDVSGRFVLDHFPVVLNIPAVSGSVELLWKFGFGWHIDHIYIIYIFSIFSQVVTLIFSIAFEIRELVKFSDKTAIKVKLSAFLLLIILILAFAYFYFDKNIYHFSSVGGLFSI